jgi:TrpR-related protein YerC/YecD
MIRMARSFTNTPYSAPALVPTGAGVLDAVAGIEELAAAIRTLRTTDEVTRFLRDLCTRAELEALAHRWQTARLLDEGVSYLEIAERVPTSTATVTRVAQWVKHGTGGYRTALTRARRR